MLVWNSLVPNVPFYFFFTNIFSYFSLRAALKIQVTGVVGTLLPGFWGFETEKRSSSTDNYYYSILNLNRRVADRPVLETSTFQAFTVLTRSVCG